MSLVGIGARIELAAPGLAWVPGGPGRTVRLEAGARGHRLAASIDVLAGAISGMPGTARLRRLLVQPATVPAARIEPFAEELGSSFRVLAREVRQPGEIAPGMIAAHLALLCLHVWRLADAPAKGARVAPERAASVAQRFRHLLELHLRDGWSVKRYADVLGVTEDRLHAASVRSHGRPPGTLIRERLLEEACSQLETTDVPVEQIAFALGFRDPGYFSRFCRRHLGMPPGRYRRERRAHKLPAPGGSYAAWP
ncbi:helix-turn-helix transcriptional regulator [Enterovirga aerilata]|uniref:Helix-turn-helix domain-containing protein n=1 Tax=Enterovirga aerilata TaxID=2730920 RepID=A0A849I0N9_9HYPH|nr:AraC family transcriptional regulator [Enterovirga sp. DB1703]NNM70961.1 helix-turn-helix domain-containing protein [Enterovirga sp. DB1703]